MLAAIVGAMLAGFTALLIVSAKRAEVRADDVRLAIPSEPGPEKQSLVMSNKIVGNVGW